MSRSLSKFALAAALAGLLPASALAAKGKPLRTGQTVTYGAAGDTTAGIRRSLVDNGQGWIKDQRTGLMWEKKDDSSGVHGKRRTYTWSTSGSNTASGTVFTTFLATLNTAPCFAGFCDWRLPTRFELDTITNLGEVASGAPSVDAIFDTACTTGCEIDVCSCTDTNAYWTSSTFAEDPGRAWVVLFTQGAQAEYSKTSNLQSARAVRNFR